MRYSLVSCVVWDSVVGIATFYGPDGPGIWCRWEKFSAHVQTVHRADPFSYRMDTGLFLGV